MPHRVLLASSFVLSCACAPPPGPTGPEKAAAYHAQEARREEERRHPTPPSEAEATLQFPFCQGRKARAFPRETEGADYRAILFFRITDEGKTAEHCYLAVEGDRKWEETTLGQVADWAYPLEFAGQPRESVLFYRRTE